MTGPNYRGLAWIAAAPFVLLAIVVYNEPRLFLWLVAVAVLLVSGAVWVVAIGFKAERDEARAELARRDREDAARMESRLLSGETVPSLRIVCSPIPMQRRGDEWDAIVRAVEEES